MASKRPGPSAESKKTILADPKKIVSPAMQALQKKLASKATPYITAKDLQDLMEETTERLITTFQKHIEEQFEKLTKELCEKFSEIFKCCAAHKDSVQEKVDDLEEQMDDFERGFENMEDNMNNFQNELLMTQYNQMEFALRIRGLQEDGHEKLKEKVASSLALALGCDSGKIFMDIEKIYRVNSRVALQRNLPRDVVVYFTRKDRQNEIIQTFYQQKFQIANQNIILLKEIPHRILQKRRDYAFLTQELRDRQIPFRWNIPIGIMLTFNNKRYRLKTLEEAKEFYAMILNVGKSSSPSSQQTPEVGENVVAQRMTRAAYKWKTALDKEKKGT